MADPTNAISVTSTLINLIPVAFGVLITVVAKPIDELIHRRFVLKEEERKEAKEKRLQQENSLRSLFILIEAFKNESHKVFQIYIDYIEGVAVPDMPLDIETKFNNYKTYDFTQIRATLYLDSPKLSFLWGEVRTIRDQLCAYMYSTGNERENGLVFYELIIKFDKAVEDLVRMIGFVITGEQLSKFSHLLHMEQTKPPSGQ